ncbi:MAG: GAF domain-containing protein [Hahellaceae bacterium]|nr:GAF domain-containing protein [Hahellaceae bacterium]MCP5170058.1 GAF domain-containing protein [Hahellaceae bacterium]
MGKSSNPTSFSQLIVAYGSAFAKTGLVSKLARKGISCIQVDSVEAVKQAGPVVLVVDDELLTVLGKNWLESADCYFDCLAEDNLELAADFFVPAGFPEKATLKNIETALTHWVLKKQFGQLNQVLESKAAHLSRLAEIGTALSAEKDLGQLLDRILHEGRKLACCDAASLFLVDDSKPDDPQLVFKLTQNASIDFPFEEQRFPLNDRSIVGYVAKHGLELKVDDAYHLPADAPYQFNRYFDETNNYRSVSLLTMPMKNHREEVIGVLQFLNRTSTSGVLLTTPEEALEHVIPFDDGICVLLRALASQSAIAIENRILIESIRRLFDGFVQASVAAIEQRDPTTSGHSFRVADLSEGLARALPRCDIPSLRNAVLDDRDMRQLKYAALLHDFGKVGVREQVLTKPKKLTSHQLDVICYRIRLAQESLKRQAAEEALKFLRQGFDEQHIRQVQEQVKAEIERLEQFWCQVHEANEPKVLAEALSCGLEEIHAYEALDCHGHHTPLISTPEYLALSIPKGSLSEEERLEIQSHVTHTENFLKLIPWTPDLMDIPVIAGAHHEKLDGTGYPRGLDKGRIPLPSQIMTVCDIYDALTASDRPYKPAVPLEVAFRILNDEARQGLLNPDLVKVFIDAKVNEVVIGRDYPSPGTQTAQFSHHVCDFDLIDHNH